VVLGRGVGLWPAFFDRTSLTLFSDIGSAWCPALYETRPAPATSLCTLGDYDIGRTTFVNSYPAIYRAAYSIGSVGGELSLTAAMMDWDRPVRYRVGLAHPVIGRNVLAGVNPWTAYATVGLSF
jgi:hypothetical protein